MTMSKGDRDGCGFRHHKRCPELNCDGCVNGRAKQPARRKERKAGKLEARNELYATRLRETVQALYGQPS